MNLICTLLMCKDYQKNSGLSILHIDSVQNYLGNSDVIQRLEEKLLTLRTRKNLTTRELAAALEVKYTHITNMEKGRSKPSLELLLRIALYFEVSLDQLLRDELEV